MNVLCYVTFSLLTMAGPFWLVSDCALTRGGGENFFVICRVILSGGGGSINRIADFFRPYRPALV